MCAKHELEVDPIAPIEETLPTTTATWFHDEASDVDKHLMAAETEKDVRRILDEAAAAKAEA